MPYLNFQALKELLDYSQRVMARVDMPSSSVLDAWVVDLQKRASSAVWYEYRDAVMQEGRMDHPYNSVQAAPGSSPPALLLILSQTVDEHPRNLVANQEDWLALLDVLERWDVERLKLVLSGDGFNTEALYQNHTTEPLNPPVSDDRSPLPPPPPPSTGRLNIIAIGCGITVLAAGAYWWARR